MKRQFVSLVAVLAVTLALPASAETITLYRGANVSELGITDYNGTIDIKMRDNAGDYNAGAHNFLVAGVVASGVINRSLIRFDLSDLDGWTVTADATLRLKVNLVHDSPDGGDYFDLHRIHDTNAGFIEGTKNDLPALNGEPTWNNFAHHSSTPTHWVNSSGTGDYPGLGAAGDGYASSAIATLNQSSYVVDATVDITISQATMQSLIDDNDFELLLRSRDESNLGRLSFYSAEDSGSQPRLIITAAIPEPSSLVLLATAGLVLVLCQLRRRRHQQTTNVAPR